MNKMNVTTNTTDGFYVFLTVHLGSVLVNNQLDAQFFFRIHLLIPILCMFRASLCSSSGESVALIRYLVYVTLCRGQSSVQVWMELRINKLILLIMSTGALETSRKLE